MHISSFFADTPSGSTTTMMISATPANDPVVPTTTHSGGSNNSCASVDQERTGRRSHNNHPYIVGFGVNPAFEEARQRLANRVEEGLTIGDCEHKTRVLERLGGGSFGEVYLGEEVESQRRVAVKIEPAHCVVQSLLHEGKVYRKLQNGRGIPTVHWYGLHGLDFAALVMELMGPTLYRRWADCKERFSLKTVLMLADQMLEVIEHVHANSFVHRDISPNNFMLGVGDKSDRLHLIDFGHAKEILPATVFVPARRHRFSFAQPMVGTPRFASVFTHMGLEPSYRDDMESLGYIWVYLLKGRLPWQGLRSTDQHSKMDLIAQTKCQTPIEDLCEGLPQEFLVYMNYVRNLRHLEMPDHAKVREFFRGLAATMDIEYDGKFDWTSEAGSGASDTNSNSSSSSSSNAQLQSADADREHPSEKSDTRVSN